MVEKTYTLFTAIITAILDQYYIAIQNVDSNFYIILFWTYKISKYILLY